MTTPERRLMAIRIVRLEQLLEEACDRLEGVLSMPILSKLPVVGFGPVDDARAAIATARAALEPTCMACGGAPCVCEKGAES